MFFLHGHFLRINGLIDADRLQKQDGGGEEEEINKALRVTETLPTALPLPPPWHPTPPMTLGIDEGQETIQGPSGSSRVPRLGEGVAQRWAALPDQLSQAVPREQALLPGIGCAQLLYPPATRWLGTTVW